jgi:HSP20 family molecular chaperone IbpA
MNDDTDTNGNGNGSPSKSLDTRPVHEVGDRPVLAPAVDIFESPEEYRLVADLPGVRQEDVDIGLERGELTLFAKRDLGRTTGEPLALGRREGDFRRVFRIPNEVEPGSVEASFENGVLQVRLPKSERVKPRRISIKAVA